MGDFDSSDFQESFDEFNNDSGDYDKAASDFLKKRRSKHK